MSENQNTLLRELDHHSLDPVSEQPDHAENGPDDHDNLALESAIGDAFKQFGFLGEEHEHKESDRPEGNIEKESRHVDELNLEESVSQAFASIGLSTDNYSNQERVDSPSKSHDEETSESKADHEVKHEDMNEELNLEDVIGDAFRSITGNGASEEGHREVNDEQASQEQNHYIEQFNSQGQNQSELLQQEQHSFSNQPSRVPQHQEEVHQNKEIPENAPKQSPNLARVNQAAHTELSHQQNDSQDGHLKNEEETTVGDDDANLEEAIGAAFQSLVDQQEGKKESQQQPSPSDIGSSNPKAAPIPNRRESVSRLEDNIDLAGLVSNVVQQIAGENEAVNVESAIPKDVLQELAAEITHQVHVSDESHPKVEIPLLDESVLMHFQKEANKEEDKQQGNPISSALASAVRTAIKKVPQGNVTEKQHAKEGDHDLENLQMNEIFQNAFDMAMLKPQELLTSFEGEPELSLPDEVKRAAASAKSQTVSNAAKIAALSVKDALDKKSSEANHRGAEQERKKSLSIAETLAYHRSAMNAKKPPVEKPPTQQNKLTSLTLNPQLSNILSSLSQHIQSGSQSQNLMLLIRLMTNALMHNKGTHLTSSFVQETLTSLREAPDAHKFFIDNLTFAKEFLASSEFGDFEKASLIIDTVLETLLSKENRPPVDSSVEVPKSEASDMMDLYNSVLNTLTSFGTLRGRNGILGVKPDTESEEYKERVRLDNRERKKKWREGNAERNKDNDLRSRVIKRANVMFGEQNTEEKKAWIEEEFHNRRMKRIAKQKKEEAKISGNKTFNEELMEKSSKNPNSLNHDEVFIKRLTNAFNLVTELGSREEPKAIMNATSAVIALVTGSYAVMAGRTEKKVVTTAMTQVLNTILDSTVKTGDYSRLSFLLKSEESAPSAPTYDTKELMNRISELTGSSSSLKGASAFEVLKNSQKRLGFEIAGNDNKRNKVEDSNRGILETDKNSINRIQSEIDQLRNSISTSASGGFLTLGLKMPLYKVTTSSVKEESPRPLPKGPLPFISNKLDSLGEVSLRSGLKKPGSFQKPAVSKQQRRGNNLGFPPLYSASFELK